MLSLGNFQSLELMPGKYLQQNNPDSNNYSGNLNSLNSYAGMRAPINITVPPVSLGYGASAPASLTYGRVSLIYFNHYF